MAWGILVSIPGIGPVPLALEAWSLIHWITREIHASYFYHCSLILKAESIVTLSDASEPHSTGNFDEWPLNSIRTTISSFFDRTHDLSVASNLLLPLITSSNKRL